MSSIGTSSPLFSAHLPIPPGINHSYRIVSSGSGRMRLAHTPAAQQFVRDAQLALTQGYQDTSVLQAIRETKHKTPLAVILRCYFKDMWKRDVDGVIKAALDEVFTYLALNDTLIVRLEATKYLDEQDPRIEVEVYLYSTH